MRHDNLGIYLNDHLAGSTVGIELARRIARKHSHSARAEDLQRLADDIDEDRDELLTLMDTLGVGVRQYKIYGGWIAEKAGRLKPNGNLYRKSGLSTLVELETLYVGIRGKAALWEALIVVAAAEPRLEEPRLRELVLRAQAQADTVESLRRTAAAAVLAEGRPAAGQP